MELHSITGLETTRSCYSQIGFTKVWCGEMEENCFIKVFTRKVNWPDLYANSKIIRPTISGRVHGSEVRFGSHLQRQYEKNRSDKEKQFHH